MIKVLSKDTIDKIAAGEVIERPISVIKELVENSIDAGANAISVEIKGGGIDYMRVTDNGCGIPADQIELAFMRHATSKIDSPTDLFALRTLGFRGEALASIAAVSNTRLMTKTADTVLGTDVYISGGNIESKKEAALPDGSSFIISDLFFNTPARRKFLKSANTEASVIEDTIRHLAMSRADISFRFISNGKEKIFTSGKGDLKQCIFELYGLSAMESLLDFNAQGDSVDIHGFIGKSAFYRSSRKEENFFINGRYIKNSVLSNGLESGYEGYLMQHQFPFCILFFDFPDGSTDVNVHPSKMEARFNEPDKVRDFLKSKVYERLSSREDIEVVPLEKETPDLKSAPSVKSLEVKGAEPFEITRRSEYSKINDAVKEEVVLKDLSGDEFSDDDFSNDGFFQGKEKPKEDDRENTTENRSPGKEIEYVAPEELKRFISESAKSETRIIGQVFDTYWLFEYEDKLYILDQHAAHEKVLYEKLIKKIEAGSGLSQQVMPPIIVSLSAVESDMLEKNIDAFLSIGFLIEHFGGMDYYLKGVPAGMGDIDPKELFYSTLVEGVGTSSKIFVQKIASISCKAAVKGNQRLSTSEIKALIDELLTLENPYHCPHGRPTVISFSRADLDKKFKRII